MRRHVCIIAGEASGDFLGSKLMQAMPGCTFTGIGGPQMNAAGLSSLFPYEELSVMGVAEILPRLPQLLARIQQAAEHIVATKPDIVVTIDSPDFCFRVIRAAKKRMMQPPKFVHYVAPTVWAWREGRAEKISRFLDGLICLFDFEPPYFEKYGLKSVAVGHPLVEGDALKADGARFREEFGITSGETIVGVLFGSRRGELKRTGPVLREAITALAGRMSIPPHIVAPTLPHVYPMVMDLLRDYPGPIHVFTDAEHKWDAFKSFDVAMATSGTVGLELAALQLPHVIGYKMNPITAMLVKRLVKVRYAHLANIMADREIVPEFIQDNCRPDLIADKAFQLFIDPAAQKADMAGIAFRLGAGQEKTPSQKAADFLLSL